MAKDNIIQTPGEPLTEAAEGDDTVLDQGNEIAAIITEKEAGNDELGEMVIELQEQLTAAKAEIARLSAQLESAGVQVVSAEVIAEGALPNNSDVNPNKIKQRVLTQQGWVLPIEKTEN